MTMQEPTQSLGIGSALREARIRRGRSIGQAHQATRIARDYLEALEAEDWSKLPAAPFARGFLSSYADYLGLESGPLLERFPLAPTAPGEGLETPPAAPTTDQQALSQTSNQRIQPRKTSIVPWVIAAVVVLVVTIGAVGIVSLRDPVIAPPEPRVVPGIRQAVDIEAEAEAVVGRREISRDPLPDLRDPRLTAREAINYVQNTGAPFVVITVHDEAPAGAVIEQIPAPGSQIDPDGAVTLVISRGPRVAPAVDGG